MRFVLVFLLFYAFSAQCSDALRDSSRISSEGLMIQSERMKIIAQNIANSETTALIPGAKPYTRKVLNTKTINDSTVKSKHGVRKKVNLDKKPYTMRYEPNHPAANEDGYVLYPNVDIVMETVDAKEAQRTFEANLSALDIARSNTNKMLEALK